MRLKLIFTGFILTMLFVFVADGQQKTVGAPGTEIPLHQQKDTAGNSCYVYQNYIVMASVSSEDDGEDIKVYKRSTAANSQKGCALGNRRPSLSLKDDGDSYFYGLAGDKILIDSGTSAGIRGLSVASIPAGKVIYSTSYQGDVRVDSNTVVYDKPSDTKGSLKNCPKARVWRKQGGGEGWVRQTRIDLTTLAETPARNLKCVYVE